MNVKIWTQTLPIIVRVIHTILANNDYRRKIESMKLSAEKLTSSVGANFLTPWRT